MKNYIILGLFFVFLVSGLPAESYANTGAVITEENSLEHDTSNGISNSLVKVDSDTFSLTYQDAGYDGSIPTFTIL